MWERLPSRALIRGPPSGSFTRWVFAWPCPSGRMTRLVVVRIEGADRAPVREVFCLSTGASWGRHSRQIRPLDSRRYLIRLVAFPFFASFCIVVQNSQSEEPETLRLPLYGHHRPMPVHRSLGRLTVVGGSVCTLHRSDEYLQSSASGAVREARGSDLYAVITLSRERQPKYRPRGGWWYRVLLRLACFLSSQRERALHYPPCARISGRVTRMRRLRLRHPPFRGTCSRTLGVPRASLSSPVAKRWRVGK